MFSRPFDSGKGAQALRKAQHVVLPLSRRSETTGEHE